MFQLNSRGECPAKAAIFSHEELIIHPLPSRPPCREGSWWQRYTRTCNIFMVQHIINGALNEKHQFTRRCLFEVGAMMSTCSYVLRRGVRSKLSNFLFLLLV